MRNKKILLLAAGILCGVGILISAVSFFVLGLDYTRLDLSSELEQKIYSVSSSEIQAVEIESESCAVEVVKSADQDINLVYYVNEHKQCDITPADGTLKMSYREHWSWKSMFQMFRGFKDINNVILVQVPIGYEGDVSVDAENSRVTADGVRIGGNLNLEAENGRVQVQKAVSGTVTASSSNGSVKVEDTQADTVKLSSENASVTVEGVSGQFIDLTSQNGRITASNSSALLNTHMKSENGAIRLEGFAASNLRLESDNGSIRGDIKGKKSDYQISCTARNGSANLENRLDQNAPYTLEVKSTNGSIRLDFDED